MISQWIYGQYPWVLTRALGMNPSHKKGDLVELNKFGTTMLMPSHSKLVKIGIVICDAYDIFYPDKDTEDYVEYWGYDILFGDQLITMIPEDFISKVIIENEKDNKKVEDIPD